MSTRAILGKVIEAKLASQIVQEPQFEAIHPFRDGNGRVGRLLIPLMLCAHERLTEPLLYMSAYFDRNRDAYVNLLLRVRTHGAWREWIALFLQGVSECAQDGLRLADGLLALIWPTQRSAMGVRPDDAATCNARRYRVESVVFFLASSMAFHSGGFTPSRWRVK